MRKFVTTLLAGSLVIAACGGDDDDAGADTTAVTPATTAPTTTDAPSTTDAPATTEAPATTAPTTEAPPTTAPTTDAPEPEFDEVVLQEMLLDAQPGDVIEIPAGTFNFDRSLSLTVDGVTIRGAGMDNTILSFANQEAGAEGMLVSASDFVIEDLAIEDTAGDALKVNEGDNIVIRRVRTEWTNGYATENGAYGIYPVQTTNVLVEDSIAIGASDAGIYVGQSNNVIVRNNRAEFNVAGIEIENTIGADVYGNVATNNTGGLLVFNMPGIDQRGGQIRVYDNDIVANNTENFSRPGTAVSVVPVGSGVVIMANDDVEIFGNRIADHYSGNVIMASNTTVGITSEGSDYEGAPEGIFIYDNAFEGGGDQPDSIVAALQAIVFPDGGDLPDIIWDGTLNEDAMVNGEVLPENRICVQEADGVEVINADINNAFAGASVGIDEYDCTLDLLPPVELDGA